MKKTLIILSILLLLLYVFRKPIISEVNFKIVNKLHPFAKYYVIEFLAEIEEKTGYDVLLVSGYRTFAEQQILYNQNNNNAKAGYSFHNYGLAIDINILKNGYPVLRKNSSATNWINSGIIEIANKYNLYWGGNFNDNNHFDFRNYYNINNLHQIAVNYASEYNIPLTDVKGNELQLS